MRQLYSLLHSQATDRNIHVIHLHGRHILNLFFNLRLELLGNGKELNTVIQHNLYTDNNTLAVVAAAAHLNGGDALYALQLAPDNFDDILQRAVGNQQLAVKAERRTYDRTVRILLLLALAGKNIIGQIGKIAGADD